MAFNFYPFAKAFLFALDAECAHDAALNAMQTSHHLGLQTWLYPKTEMLPTTCWNINFPNPVGLAAGLDKNGRYLDALSALGFGFIEIGTTTPRPQIGNPKPRIFRIPEHQALINRLGFNNEGVNALVGYVERAQYRGVLGINIGKNKETPNDEALQDYQYCLERVYPYASYVTINISSPNTQGLRDLQAEEPLRQLISELKEQQTQLATQHGAYKPLIFKVAPDLDLEQIDTMSKVFLDLNIDGLICTNTTIQRTTIPYTLHSQQQGGLSGQPLFPLATQTLHDFSQRLGGNIPIIGVGGILSGTDAQDKIRAGASLIQFYTGFIYRGPELIQEAITQIMAIRK